MAEARADDAVWTTGRRKTAVARIRMLPGSGRILINSGKTLDLFLGSHGRHKFKVMQPLKYVDQSKFDIFVNVSGGGMTGQVEAIRLGIARALFKIDPALRPKLKAEGLLMRDPRKVERKKPGQPKARKKFQWTKR
jgi:small subunit ribosomal protein S9